MLNIREKRVHAMARELAERRGVTMTAVVAAALERELAIENAKPSVSEALLAIGRASAAKAAPGGRDLTPEERDALWSR
jgi:hypothetical protein